MTNETTIEDYAIEYAVHPQTHEYMVSPEGEYIKGSPVPLPLGEGHARISGYTFIPPISRALVGEHQAVVLRDAKPRLVEDHRGRDAYSTETGDPVRITTLGPLASNVTLEKRPSRFHEWVEGEWRFTRIEDARKFVWESIKAVATRKEEESGVVVEGKLLHSSAKALENLSLSDVVFTGKDHLYYVPWPTLDGQLIALNKQMAFEYRAAIANLRLRINEAREEHKKAIYAHSDPLSYDVNAGWPPAAVEQPISEQTGDEDHGRSQGSSVRPGRSRRANS
uniref:DUF4376 domain-containing protein n=1 Tax=Candidatus Kentrum sp. TC TaxID=2126339 RepID=A0A451A9N2_9GAMM|nr:MAG: hypothetical protein BECKTC1821F_GA0114240_10797 [Candidatus Kentron sp. TC]